MTDIALDRDAARPTSASKRRPNAALSARDAGVPVLDVVVPVYNEQAALADSVHRLHRHLRDQFPFPARITIADNASVDDTPRIAAELAAELDRRPGRAAGAEGPRPRAARGVVDSDAPVLAYMDVDLSTDLAALAPLVAPLISGHSDLAIGTRLGRGSRVVRGAKREIISRCYNLILKSTLAARFSDAQCGFKAIRADVAHRLLPHVADTGWFFDTELLVLAERSGLRIHEVPVDWVDDPDSRVDIVGTAAADLKGIARLLRGFADGLHPRATPLPHSWVRPTGGAHRARCCARWCGSERRRRLHGGLPAAVHAAARVARRPGREPDRAAGHRDRQHRGQPPLHLRYRGSGQRRAPPRRGTHRLRHRAGHHQWRAGRRCTPSSPDPHRLLELTVLVVRQPGGHRRPLRPAARLGVPPAPNPLTHVHEGIRSMTLTADVETQQPRTRR